MKSRKQKSAWTIFFKPIKVIFVLLLIALLVGAVIGGIVYWNYRDEIKECRQKAYDIMEKTSIDDFSKPGDTKIYDSDNNLIGLINSGHYEYVDISGISQNLQNAYIAQEDQRFLEHKGVDWIGLTRAGVALIKNKGTITQGGSTITQQVIKNTYLTQEKSFTRKLTEIFAAPLMEKKYSKDQIMEFYCNSNFYANRCYGVAEASRFYFDKEASELTVWEAATLAGISNNPSRYDPAAHPEASMKKRNQIIDNMEKHGMISEYESTNAKAQPVEVKKISQGGTKETYQSSYAIHSASLELMKNDDFAFQYSFTGKESYEAYKERYQEAYQEKSDLIRSGGFEIHTSLDSRLQTMLQEAVDEKLSKFDELQENGKFALQGAAVSVDNKTGQVVAIVGGRGTEDEYNRGFLSKRQPGSTIKPLIDYGPAFDSGFYYPSRFVDDHLFEGGPKNSSGKYHGTVSVREALNRSLNTVAWQVLQDIGVDTGIDYLERMHFTGLSYMDNGNASMSIGGFTDGSTVTDMAMGYATLANEGKYSNKTCITGITSQYEGELYRNASDEIQIYTRDTAYMVTDVLKGTLDKPYGTGYGLGLSIPSAGKTGTTNSNKDTWFCGYTKYYTTAVWVGYDTPRAMPGVYGKTYAGAIWKKFMDQCNEGLPSEDWSRPVTVSLEYVDSIGEKTSSDTGTRDLFSAVAEEEARANSKRWDDEEKRKEQVKKDQAYAASQNAAGQAAQQIEAELSGLVGEINAAEYQNSSLQEKIGRVFILLESMAGTPAYDTWKPLVDAAAGRASSLPAEVTTQAPSQSQEIGPGITPNPPPTEAPTNPPQTNQPPTNSPPSSLPQTSLPPQTMETVPPPPVETGGGPGA